MLVFLLIEFAVVVYATIYFIWYSERYMYNVGGNWILHARLLTTMVCCGT